MRIRFAERCGWTAIYLTFGRGRNSLQFHLGVDPHEGSRPELFAGALNRWYPWRVRFTLPHVPWTWVQPLGYHPVALFFYRLSYRFWRLFDRRSR